jgi:RNA methyltransferase, TrmH family
MKMITSVHNTKVQEVRRLLRQAKVRREQQELVVEGVRLAEEALRSGWDAHLVLYTEHLEPRGKTIVEAYINQGVPAELVSEGVMNSLSETETPQGILVVLAHQVLPIPPSPHFLLILDGIRDPGNLGTILRTAAAAGVQAVLLAPGCVDVTSPKVLRSGMGAHFHLPLCSLSWSEIAVKLKTVPTIKVYLADSGRGMGYTLTDFSSPMALIVGGEAAGAGEEAAMLADERVHIPMPGSSESLNAAIAAGILLFEVVRQRAGREN